MPAQRWVLTNQHWLWEVFITLFKKKRSAGKQRNHFLDNSWEGNTDFIQNSIAKILCTLFFSLCCCLGNHRNGCRSELGEGNQHEQLNTRKTTHYTQPYAWASDSVTQCIGFSHSSIIYQLSAVYACMWTTVPTSLWLTCKRHLL